MCCIFIFIVISNVLSLAARNIENHVNYLWRSSIIYVRKGSKYTSAVVSDFTHWKSSHQRCSIKKGVLRNFKKFIGKHLCQSLSFNKVEGLRPETLLKKRLWHRCFPVNFVKFLRTPFLTEHVWWLLVALSLKKREGKPYQYQPLQRFFSEYT